MTSHTCTALETCTRGVHQTSQLEETEVQLLKTKQNFLCFWLDFCPVLSRLMSQPPFSLLQSFFPHLPLFRYNYKALDECNYASIRHTQANALGHLHTRYYPNVNKCPFFLPFCFYSTNSLLSTSKMCVYRSFHRQENSSRQVPCFCVYLYLTLCTGTLFPIRKFVWYCSRVA